MTLRRIAGTVGLAAFLALQAGISSAAGVHIEFNPTPTSASPGDTIDVECNVFLADASFNAFDLNIGFDPSQLSYITQNKVLQRGALMTAACGNIFDTFVADSAELRVTLGLLCAGVSVTGPGVIYQVKFEALPGLTSADIVCTAGTAFFNEGPAVTPPLECNAGTITADVSGLDFGVDGAESALSLSVPTPNPHRGGPATFGFTLPRADEVFFELFDTSGRLVRKGDPAAFSQPGRHEVIWDPGSLASGVYYVRLVTASGGTVKTPWVILR